MLKRISFFALLASLLVQFSACKNDKKPNVGFDTATVNLDAINSPTATVNVNVSAATDNIVEVWFEMDGPDTLQFGTFNNTFLNDDSFRISGVLGSIAFIDTPHSNNYVSHVSIPYSATSFSISLKALFDNFPKRAVSYKIKITQVVNGTISGNNVLTINIAATPMTPAFTGDMSILQPNGALYYTLASTTFLPQGAGKWNVGLNYNLSKGSDSLQSFTLSFSNITLAPGLSTYIDDAGLDTLRTNFVLSKTPSSVRGNYYVMPISENAVKLVYKDSVGLGALQSTFVLF